MDPNPNFTTTLVVAQTPLEVFRAITNPRGWWSEAIKGGTEKLGDEFTYHYQDVHRCRIRLIEVVPDKTVVWHVLDNQFNFTADETEWKGTKIIFAISRQGDQTELRFTHQGLVPAYECFDVCSNAWGSYINGSLKSLITTGRPNAKEPRP